MENKRDRFKRIATRRMQNVLTEINRLINCSNKNHYEYTEKDIQKMLKKLNEKIFELKNAFATKDKPTDFNF